MNPGGIEQPTEASALRALTRAIGPVAASQEWRAAREYCGIEDGELLDFEGLRLVASALSNRFGLAGVCGTSLVIRAEAWAELHGGNDVTTGQPMTDVERARLEEIASLDLTSREVDEILQNIVTRSAERLSMPISMISIVLEEAQYFTAFHGIDGPMLSRRGTPIEWSFCKYAVESREPFIVEDATSHPVVKDNEVVVNQGIRCYAGIPLITSTGHALGTLCVIDKKPRTFTEDDLDVLREAAREAVARIEERRDRNRIER